MYVPKQKSGGFVKPLVVSFILAVLLFMGSSAAAVTFYAGQQDYKNNADAKIKKAVTESVAKTKVEKDNEYAQKDKSPLREYSGPSAYGSIVVKYPKTWSAYVVESGSKSTVLDGYFDPIFVSGDSKATHAFRLQVIGSSYDTYTKQYDANIKAGKVKASAYRLPNVTSELGLKFDGEIGSQKKGSLVAIKLRDKTLLLWAESDQFIRDFEEFILPNVTFIP